MRVGNHLEMLVVSDEGRAFYPALAWDDHELVLADACFAHQILLLEEAVRGAGFALEGITKIILTHQDHDHIGGVREVLKRSPRAQILAHTLEAPYIDGSETPIKVAAREANLANLSEEGRAALLAMKENFKKGTVPISQTLSDGELLPCCGGIRVLHSPGHTPGHICLLMEESGVLIAGDALNIAENGALAGPNPMHTYDMREAADSLRKLLPLGIKKVIAYHGGLFEGDVNEALAQILAG